MSQIDTTPPATWHPQPEAEPYDWDDTEQIPPEPHLYVPKWTAVHQIPSQRIILKNFYLPDVNTIVRILDKSEQGIGSRATLQVHQASTASVAIAASREDLEAVWQYNAVYGAVPPQAYLMPFLATSIPQPLTIPTCDELWARCTGPAGHATLSVMLEQFYAA